MYISVMNPNDKPFPIRLGELKPILQQIAVEKEWSLHFLVKKIVREYLVNTGKLIECQKK